MRAIFFTVVVSALLGGGGVYAWYYFGGFEEEKTNAVAFINTYGDYSAIAQEVEALVHMPGVEENSDRAELERLLTSLLTDTLTQSRREELARLAYNNLIVLKREVDTAQTKQAQLYKVLEELDTSSKLFTGAGIEKQAGDIVAGARKRAELSARITSVLSEMNEQTYAIITRILEDKGELTQEHIQYINDTTAYAEERFATLSGLYTDLQQKTTETETLFAQFVKDAV
jgi:hypothetical protein